MARRYQRKSASEVSATRSRARQKVLNAMTGQQRRDMMADVWPHSPRTKRTSEPLAARKQPLSERMKELRITQP